MTIPESIGGVNWYAFTGCSSLVDVTCLAATPPTAVDGSFDQSTYTSATLHVPALSLDAYKAATCWKEFTAVEGIYKPGDVNCDGAVDVSDVTALIAMILNGNTSPVGDINNDDDVDVSDVTLLIAMILNAA